jgi:RNA polymerase sigma factor (sigma-70 family)
MTLLTEDSALLAAFREGRREALERVYRHYVGDVVAFLARRFPSRAELEAVTQEVFIRAFSDSARAGYDGLRPYRAFLLGVARNTAMRALERRAGESARFAPLDEDEAGPPPAPEQDLHAARGRELVAAFLAGACDDRDRKLFQLRFDEGLSQEAAAQAAGLTRIQVRRWESKLRARLLRQLKRAGYVGDDA